MQRLRSESWRLVAAILLLALVPAATLAGDRALIRLPFAATGADSGAEGWLVLRIEPATGGAAPVARLEIRASDLEPRRVYELLVGAERPALIRSDHQGRVDSTFGFGEGTGSGHALDADPRGSFVALSRLRGSGGLLAYVGGSMRAAGSRHEIRTALEPTSVAPAGGEASLYALYRPSQRLVELQLDGMPAGYYALRVDGRWRANVHVRSPGRAASTELRSPAPKGTRALDFDPRGAEVEVLGARGRLFEGELRARIPEGASGAAELVSFTVLIPDFESKHVDGVILWRRDDGAQRWRRAAVVETGESGSGTISYRALEPGSGAPLGAPRESPGRSFAGGDGRIFTFVVERPGPSARFKVSTFNRAGVSPRSQNTVRR